MFLNKIINLLSKTAQSVFDLILIVEQTQNQQTIRIAKANANVEQCHHIYIHNIRPNIRCNNR